MIKENEGMKHLPVVILLMVVALVAVVTGCRGKVRYDARLVAADSLLATAPDSALTLVEALTPDSLTTDGDRAYRDLLVTQARYKCYITATSDSDINRALAYYRAHDGEQEKLTRAYIYKGAVMEELGHPDSAMFYYKHAEATAAPDDYFNLGYVNLRMGSLYSDYNATDGKHIEKFEKAYKYLLSFGDSITILMAMNNLGCSYRETKPKLAEKTLNKALQLAYQLNDTVAIIETCHSLIVMYYENLQYKDARRLAQEILRLNLEELHPFVCFSMANVYAKLGMPDSAMTILQMNHYDQTDNAYNKMYLLESLSEISLARGDTLAYLQMNSQSERFADSLKSNYVKYDILSTENKCDSETRQLIQTKQKKTLLWLIVISTLLVSLLTLFIRLIVVLHKKRHQYDQIVIDLREEHQKTQSQISILKKHIDDAHIHDTQLREFMSSHLCLISDLAEECYHEPHNRFAKKIQKIVKYQEDNKENWTRLFGYLDLEYNNIMKDTMQNYSNLENRDYLLIALTCMGYSNAQIAIVLGYVNATSISGCRLRLAKKMGLDCSLIDYIRGYME